VYLFLRGSKKDNNKQKASAWKGKLVNKQHSDEWEDLEGHRVGESNTLIFKTNDGRKGRNQCLSRRLCGMGDWGIAPKK